MDVKYGGLYREKVSVPTLLSTEWVLASIFMLQILNGYVSELLSLWNIGTITSVVYLGIVALSAFAYFKAFVNRPVTVALLLMLAVAVIAGSCALDSAIAEYVFDFNLNSFNEIGTSELFQFFGLCFPTFLLCLLPVNITKLYEWLYRYSVIAAVLFIALMLLHIFRFAAKLNYMSVAYSIMLPFVILYFASREKHDRRATILWMGTLAGLLAGGCRGAVVTVIAWVTLWEFKKMMPITARKFFWILVILVIAAVVVINLQEILLSIDTFFAKQGYSSRLLNKYFDQSADGDLLHISDRVKLYNRILTRFNLLGYGIFADRLALNGQYAHNIVFEIIYQYGYLFGVPILVAAVLFLGMSFSRAKRSRTEFQYFVCFAFIVYLCTKMMVSASYVTDREVWLCFGLCLAIFRQSSRKYAIVFK